MRFLWDSEKDKKKIHWVSWKKLTGSKGQGGRCLKDLEVFNQAMLAKQAWRFIHEPEKLWVKVLKTVYYLTDNPLGLFNKKEGS